MTSFTLADADTVRQFAESHVDEGWDPVEFGNEDQIGDIVMEARIKGVITGPEGAEVNFDYSADGDGGGFQYLVRLTREVAGKQRTITLASPFNEMRNVVSSEVTGPAAVTEILEMAVVEANAVVADLAAYHAAEPRALVEPTLAGEVAAVLSQALADAESETLRIAGDDDYDEEDAEHAQTWHDRVEATVRAFEAAAGRKLSIQLLHGRDPDSECDITVYVDGVRFTGPVSVEDSDPGRGYEQEDYEERLEEAREAAERPGATDYDRDILTLLEESEWSYRKFSTGQWEDRPEKEDEEDDEDDEDDEELDLPEGVTLERPTLPADAPPEGHLHLVLKIENTYENYDDVTTFAIATVPAPPDEDDEDEYDEDEYDEWKMTHVIDPYTGVGHTDGDSWYDVEVLASSDPDQIPVGTKYDYGY